MARYIDAEALKELRHNYIQGKIKFNGSEYDLIDKCPTADVVEVRHGEWISASNKPGVNIGMKCSLCGARIKNSEFFNGNHNYCHKCGADMRDDKNG